jgi:glycosyltransferase involved in cell wall biosynthesis
VVTAPTGPVTVSVCTRNRVRYLDVCLSSLEAQHPPIGGLEILVVDNGSSDTTPEHLRRWRDDGPDRRVIAEPHVGLAHARNAALEHASGDVVLFLDDDAVAPSAWAGLLAGAVRDRPDVVAAGGPVLLHLPRDLPRWATPTVHHWWSETAHGAIAQPYPPALGPYGTNMAVRRNAARAVGGFPGAFGRRGRSLLSGEETELWRSLREHGGVLWYEPRAAVHHRVLDGRVSRRWIARRAVAQGRTVALHHRSAAPSRGASREAAREHLRHGWSASRSAYDLWRHTPSDPGRLIDTIGQALTHASAAVSLSVPARQRRGSR